VSPKPRKAAPGAAAAESPSSASDEGYSDRLLEDIAAEMVNAPKMRAFHQLNRRKRAELTDLVLELMPRITRFQALQDSSPSGLDLGAGGAEVMHLLADLEDVLTLIAVDPAEFATWAQDADDRHLLALFATFARSFSLGEASSSST
jgi:hypothetical protein